MKATKIAPIAVILLAATGVQSTFFQTPPATFTLVNHHPTRGIEEYHSTKGKYYENIQPHCSTIFLVHGWYPDVHASDAFENSYEELLARKKCTNIVKVTWHKGRNGEKYYEAAKRIPAIASQLAEHVVELHQLGLLQRFVKIVGHSMGAHIAGTAARIANRDRSDCVHAVLGLDPAGPGFTDYDRTYGKYKLTEHDAGKVVTLVTNRCYLGSSEPLGQTVFYANDGDDQPGCALDIMCDHKKAIDYYNNSINKEKYVGYDFGGRQAKFPSMRRTNKGHFYFSTRNETTA